MEPWVWAIVVTVALALLGVVWALVRKSTDRTERRLDEHIHDDAAAHERLKAVEIKVEGLEREVNGLRERWHEMRSEISQTLSNWYLSVVKMIGGGK